MYPDYVGHGLTKLFTRALVTFTCNMVSADTLCSGDLEYLYLCEAAIGDVFPDDAPLAHAMDVLIHRYNYSGAPWWWLPLQEHLEPTTRHAPVEAAAVYLIVYVFRSLCTSKRPAYVRFKGRLQHTAGTMDPRFEEDSRQIMRALMPRLAWVNPVSAPES